VIDLIEQAVKAISSVVYGKDKAVRLSVACLLARGHLLIEDLPGMGKTTLAHALAQVFSLDYNRVQFTSDLLPADILGGSIFDQHKSAFSFHAGPIFTQLFLADEINRTSPKTQSALLEAMEERQVSLDGITRPLPTPFFVIATQNPVTQFGTYPLPESQSDRFLMSISLGYPDAEAEKRLLLAGGTRPNIENLPKIVNADQLLALQVSCMAVKVSEAVVDYVQRLAAYSRESGAYMVGLSPRGALSLLQAAKAWALMQGRDYLRPDDVQAVFTEVVQHRLVSKSSAQEAPLSAGAMLSRVDVLGT
jgi:MoxR-like ATPase